MTQESPSGSIVRREAWKRWACIVLLVVTGGYFCQIHMINYKQRDDTIEGATKFDFVEMLYILSKECEAMASRQARRTRSIVKDRLVSVQGT